MSSSIILPMPDSFFQIFLIGFFFLHALFMNMVLGGMPVLVITEMLCWSNQHPYATRFAGFMAGVMPAAFALAVVLGIVPLMGVQVLYGRVLNEAAGIIGNLWYCAGAGLLVGYGGLHANKWWRDWFVQRPGWLLLLGCGSALAFLGIAFVFVLLNVMMLHPALWVDLQEAGWRSALALPSVWPRFLHMVCAAIAGVGMFIAGYGVYLRSQWNKHWAGHRVGEEEYGLWITRFGVIWTMTGTLPQIVVGPWLLMDLPEMVRHHLIAGETFGSLAFFFALTSALFSLVLLNAALMVPSMRGFVVAGVTGLFLTMGFMVIVRETVRFAWLKPYMEGIRVSSQIPWVRIVMITALGVLGVGFIWRSLCMAGKFTRKPAASGP